MSMHNGSPLRPSTAPLPVSRANSSTPYDAGTFARQRQALDPGGFYYHTPPDSPRPDMTVEVPRLWEIRRRAQRRLGVTAAAAELLVGETGAGLGTAEGYRRSSAPHTQNSTVSATRPPRAGNFAGAGTWKQMFWVGTSEVVGSNPNAPQTRAERRAVSRMETARRDAALSAGEARFLEEEGITRAAARGSKRHEARMHRKMRKIGRIAAGGRFTRWVAR